MTLRFCRGMVAGWSLSLLLLLANSGLQAADKVTLDQRLPAGVLAYFSIPNAPEGHANFMKTGFGQMLLDPELENFRQQLMTKFKEMSADVQEEIGVTVEELLQLPAGEVSFAAARSSNAPLAGVALIEFGNRQELVEKLLQRAEESFEEGTLDKQTESVDGVDLVTLTYADPNNLRGKPVSVTYFIRDNSLVISSASSLIKNVLSRWDGANDRTFAKSDVYKQMMEKCAPTDGTPLYRWYIDPIGLVSAGLSTSQELQMAAVLFNANLPVLGLSELKAIGGIAAVGGTEFDAQSRTLYYVNQPTRGVLNVFQLRPQAPATPGWAPADAHQYFSLDWNIRGAYEAIESMYDSFFGVGSFEIAMEQVTQRADGLDLNIKSDLIDVLTGSLQGYIINPSEVDPEDPQSPDWVVALGVESAEKATALVEKGMDALSGFEKSERNGATVYEPADEDAPGAAAVHDNKIYIASTVERLQQALDGKASPALLDSPAYQSVAKHLPAQMSMHSFMDPKGQLKPVYEALRSGQFDSFLEGELDPSTLPPFENLEKYISPSAGYIVPDEQGALQVQFTLKPSK